jgi:RNA polymerase sigma-70 factor (ECF subfamily)
MRGPDVGTSVTLLGRLRDRAADPAAWAEFVARYEPLIAGWGRRWGLQDADAHDVTQTVLLRLAERIGSFQYDPGRSFRGYIKTLARYAWLDLMDLKRRPGGRGSGDTAVLDALDNVTARDDLSERLADEFDREVYERAAAAVRARVEPHTWEAFRLTGLDGLSGAETANRLGLEVATVFKAKSKVQKMLRDEIQKLQQVL